MLCSELQLDDSVDAILQQLGADANGAISKEDFVAQGKILNLGHNNNGKNKLSFLFYAYYSCI